MADAEVIKIVEERALPGPAATLDAMLDQDDQVIAQEMGKRLEIQGAAVPGDRSPITYLLGLIRRLRGRRMIRDLGVHQTRLEWLRFHAPPGGKARLLLGRTEAGKGGVTLKFMGLGFGSGLELKTAYEHDFGERTQCFCLGSTVAVRLCEYTGADESSPNTVQVDVVERLGTYLDTLERCPRCFSVPETGGQPRRLVRKWDLTHDPHGLTEKVTYDLTDTSEIELGLDLPVLATTNLTAGIAISRSIESKCEATYLLPGNASFSAYSDLLPGLELPFWGRS